MDTESAGLMAALLQQHRALVKIRLEADNNRTVDAAIERADKWIDGYVRKWNGPAEVEPAPDSAFLRDEPESYSDDDCPFWYAIKRLTVDGWNIRPLAEGPRNEQWIGWNTPTDAHVMFTFSVGWIRRRWECREPEVREI